MGNGGIIGNEGLTACCMPCRVLIMFNPLATDITAMSSSKNTSYMSRWAVTCAGRYCDQACLSVCLFVSLVVISREVKVRFS